MLKHVQQKGEIEEDILAGSFYINQYALKVVVWVLCGPPKLRTQTF